MEGNPQYYNSYGVDLYDSSGISYSKLEEIKLAIKK